MIRRATALDTALLVELGKEMAAESSTLYPTVEESAARRWLEAADARPDRLYAAVADDKGFLTGVIGDWSFSDNLRAVCDLLYVRREYRGTSLAYRLCHSFFEWAKENGAKTIIMGSTTGMDAENFFNRLGLPKVGTIHMRAV